MTASAETGAGGDVGADSAARPAEVRGFGGKLWFWLPWPLLVAADLWSKAWVFARLAANSPGLEAERRHELVFDSAALHFELVTWGNTGTIWGLFQNGTVVLMVLRCVALFGLLWFVRTTSRAARFQLLVLSLVFAGAIGNLYDNFTRDDRSVRDFLRFSGRWPVEWDFPAFNIADSCITVGAACLFVLLWRSDRHTAKQPVS
ncbi:MAG: signal peptidase II [Planctomycetes bacterium]|nr:signal peptidase II [Planctomycetota bacterium]